MASGVASRAEKPWILVWDLDQTLVDGGHSRPAIVNLNAIKFLDEAIKLRDAKNSVVYIFLLTNNSDTRYIANSIQIIAQNILRYSMGLTKVNKEYSEPDEPYSGEIFDAIKYSNRYKTRPAIQIGDIIASDERYGTPDNPTKSLADIVDLIGLTGATAEKDTLLDYYNIMFFDDRNDHLLREELTPPNIYKVIAPMEDSPRRFSDQSFQRELELLTAGRGGGAGGGGAGGGGAERKQVGASRKRTTKRKRKNKKQTKKLTKKPRSASSPTNNAS